MLKKYLTISFILIFCNLFANDSKIYLIENIEVIIEDTEELVAREKALKSAFEKSFNTLLKKIISKKNYGKLQHNNDIDFVSFVKDYKIKNEVFLDSKYAVLIDVNFHKEKISDYLDNLNLNKVNLVSESFLTLPIYSEFNNMYLWEKKNKWYYDLLNEYDENNMLSLYFPEPNFLNNFIAPPDAFLKKNIDKMSDILDKYNKNSGIIIFLKEEYDSFSETFKADLFLTQFTREGYSEIKIQDSRLKNNISKASQRELFAKYTIEELHSWWKDQISVSNTKRKESFVTVVLQAESLKKLIFLEKTLSESIFINQLKKTNFTKNSITYEISTLGDISKINLSLRPKNIFLKKMPNSNEYKIETLF